MPHVHRVVGVVIEVGGEGGGRARRIAEFREGMRRRMIKAGGTGQSGRGSARAGGRGGRQRQRPGPVPGAGSKLRRGGLRQQPGTRRPLNGCHPITFLRWGSLLLPPVDCRGPVDGNGLDHGDKWQSNRRDSG